VNFDVVWKEEADEDLAAAWMKAADPEAVTVAANRVEQILRRDPLGHGESRGGDDRLLFEGPLGVAYRVDAQARRVLVLSVGLFGRRS
jgi:hypothetical protein